MNDAMDGVSSNDHLKQSLSAEYLVAADLTRLGFPVSTAAGGLPYDLIVDIGSSLIRVQVKSIKHERPTRRSPSRYHLLWKKNRQYHKDSFDILAVVASDIGLIGYLPISDIIHIQRLSFAGPDSSSQEKSRKLHELPFLEAIKTYRKTTAFSLDEELTKAFGAK